MHWRLEVWRLGICKGLAFRPAFDWSDPDSNAKVSGLPDGFQWIDAGEHCGVQFIEFADDGAGPVRIGSAALAHTMPPRSRGGSAQSIGTGRDIEHHRGRR